MTREQIAAAFNEWMRRYTEDPAAFRADFETVAQFRAEGKEPTYGDEQAAYLIHLVESLNG